MNRSIGRTIAKLIFWLIEVLFSWIIIEAVRNFDFEKEFFQSLIVSIFCAYLVSVIINLIVWIFNFLHKFSDYDSFSSGMYCCFAIAPITLAFHLIKHLFNIFRYLFGMEKADCKASRPNYNIQQENTDNREKTVFVNMVTRAAKDIAWNTKPAEFVNGYFSTSWEGGHLEVMVNEMWGSITFSGTINFKVESDNVNINLYDSQMEDCRERTAKMLERYMENELRNIQAKYKGYDKTYTVKTNISKRIVL